MAVPTISLKKLPQRLNLLNGSRLYYKAIMCEKKSAFCSVLQGDSAVASPKEQLYEQITLILIQPLRREIHTKSQRLSPRFSSRAKIFGHVSHSTALVHKCLACQHFDFNSADWFSDNLHLISSWYLRTMGKEFIFRFSRRSWSRNAWWTPKNVCVGG